MKPRIIALYLPQFHPIPENDKWWGLASRNGQMWLKPNPSFRGHLQPRIPADLGFYDLRLPEVRELQASLAKESGIEGFCYYHYWFGRGRQLWSVLSMRWWHVAGLISLSVFVGQTIHGAIRHGNASRPFKKDSVLIEQQYPGVEDDIAHFNSLLAAFKDRRYMTVDGKLLFVLYNPYDMPHVERFMETWRKLARENGLPGFHFVG